MRGVLTPVRSCVKLMQWNPGGQGLQSVCPRWSWNCPEQHNKVHPSMRSALPNKCRINLTNKRWWPNEALPCRHPTKISRIDNYLQGKACSPLHPFLQYQSVGFPLHRGLVQRSQSHNSDLEGKHCQTQLIQELRLENPHCNKTL